MQNDNMNVCGLNTKIKKILIFFAFGISITIKILCSSSYAAATKMSGDLQQEKSRAESEYENFYSLVGGLENRGRVNPHWDKTRCNSCHENGKTIQDAEMSIKNKEELCYSCHAEDVVHKYIHPTGISVPEEFEKRIEKNWPEKLNLRREGEITCYTCHDVLDQCLSGRSYMSRANPKFLKGAPYAKRYDICYKCHDSSKYRKMNSHEQIDESGNLKLNKCRLCHIVKDEGSVKKGIRRDLSKYPLLKKLENDRNLLCLRCHKKIDHPTSAFKFTSSNKYRHFIKITEEKKATLERMIKKTGIVLPLEPDTDRINCATCHQPHQPGVFEQGAQSRDILSPKRMRVANICDQCHEK